MKSRFIAFLATMMFALPAWGTAEQLTATYLSLNNSRQSKTAMMIRCDNSGGLSDTGPIGGEPCESGDWSRPYDCSDFQHLTIKFFAYGSGTAQLLVWDCSKIPGSTADDGGGTFPGEEDPSGGVDATDPADPDPLCYELTLPAGVDSGNFFDGLVDGGAGTQFLHLSGQQFHFIVAEIEDCTGNCDSTVILSCGR